MYVYFCLDSSCIVIKGPKQKSICRGRLFANLLPFLKFTYWMICCTKQVLFFLPTSGFKYIVDAFVAKFMSPTLNRILIDFHFVLLQNPFSDQLVNQLAEKNPILHSSSRGKRISILYCYRTYLVINQLTNWRKKIQSYTHPQGGKGGRERGQFFPGMGTILCLLPYNWIICLNTLW